LIALVVAVVGSGPFLGQALTAQSIREYKDVVYAAVDGKSLALDLYIPAVVESAPLMVWLHGGGWSQGSKAQVPREFVERGIATASVEFRQSTEARFPAQVHDVKAALRFLRAQGKTYGYAADEIVIAGSSSGGHLAALIGVTNGHKELEGGIGGHLNVSSDVQGIVVYSGASNLMTILPQSTPFGAKIRGPALDGLLGGPPDQQRQLAELASPVMHVDRADPPLLLLHGDQDLQMPINQAHEMQGAYERLSLDTRLVVVHGAGHGGPPFYTSEHLKLVLDFLARVVTGHR
jgi:acetyl esterase/lipase